MITKIFSIFLVIFSVLSFDPVSNYDYSDKLGDENYKGLKEYYGDYFDMGASVGGWHCLVPEYAEYIKKNYTSLTAENCLKQVSVNPEEGVWNFAEPDNIANFCRNNGIKLRGHCLIWGGLGSWMTRDENGNLVSKEVLYDRMYDYFSVLMPRYGDVIRTWDVVNEPFGYNMADGAFKDNDFYRIAGEEYITKAFEIAHSIDPDAVLVLNETMVVKNDAKQRYLYNYLEKWLKEGVPINAVGIQGHWSVFETGETPKKLQKLIDKLYSLGVDIQITECDMGTDVNDEKMRSLPENTKLLQAKKYAQMFEVLRKNSDKISSVTFWGMNDGRYRENENGSEHSKWKLLFDEYNMPNNSFYAVCDF